jgi:zinc protease
MSGASVAAGSAAGGGAAAVSGGSAENPADVDYGAEAYRLVDKPDEIVSVLKNGLVVITRHMATPVVAVRGETWTGGIYEGKWLGGGLSHLLEHLVAGGSSERRTEAQNRDLLQKIGNNSNAETTEDHTDFFINTTGPHMAEAVDLVTGWMMGAKITEAEFEREREVVQRELEMGEGEPDRQLFYMTTETRYRVSPAHVPVIGYQSVIKRLTRDDVYTYYKMAYQPNNMIFSVVGELDPKEMLSAVQKYVKETPPGRAFSHDIAPEPAVLAPRTVAATFPKLGQAREIIGFPSVSMNDSDLYALDLLAAALGQGESSLLVEELRDKQQLVSAIEADDETPTYAKGTFMVMMEADPDKIMPATEAALKMMDQVKTQGIDADRLARAKTGMKAALVKRRITAEAMAASLAEDYRTAGDPNFSEKYVERIEHVTPKQIQAVARKYFNRQQLLTTALFPAEWAGAQGLKKVEDVLRPVSPASQESSPSSPAEGRVVRAQLDNGTVLLLKRITTSPIVVMNMYALGGVTAEDAKTNGLGNLTMQLLTRGTSTRSAEDIATFFDATGGGIDATCNNNTWSWSANCLAADFDKTFPVYADIINNPAFPENEVGPMKKRLAAAIQSEDAQWSAQAFRYFRKEFFGPMNSPYQFTARGTRANIESFGPQQVRDWYTKKVLAGRRVLAIYGNIDVDKARAMAADLLGKGPRHEATNAPDSHNGTSSQPTATAASESQSGKTPSIDVRKVDVQKTEQALAGVVIGFQSDNLIGAPDNYDFDVAKTITGGYTYPTGYVFETLRGLGLVYVAETQNLPGRTKDMPGCFFVFAGCQPQNVNEVVDQILLNIARVQGTPQDIVPSWFDRAKELITVADAMENETPGAQASLAAVDELYGLGYAYHDQFQEKIRTVTMPQVQELARHRLRTCIVTISTPKPELVKQKTGPRTYESFPSVDLTPRGVQHDVGGTR